MSGLRKVVAAVHGPLGDEVPAVDGLVAYSVHRPHPEVPGTQPGHVTAVAMAWCEGDALPDPSAWFAVPVDAYLVDERVQIDWTRDWPDGTPSPGVEQCSFVRRLPQLTRAEFAAHWHDRHAPLVPIHHPGVARYVQNVVIEPLTEDAPEVDGIAQLSFRTVHDLRERFYDSPDGQRIVGEDVARFIDRPRGWRITAQETWLRS